MPQPRDLQDQDLQGLSPEAVTALALQMLPRLREQDRDLAQRDQHIERQASDIRLKDAKIEKLTFELARHKTWKFGARSEAMSAEQRRLFEETLAEDEASLLLQLQQAGRAGAAAGRGQQTQTPAPALARSPAHHHEPEDTTCPSPDCGKPMVRVGEDVSEKLDIVPAAFFVHRHVYGKWTCRCCQRRVQEAAAPHIIDGGMSAAGLVAQRWSRCTRRTSASCSRPGYCTRTRRRWRCSTPVRARPSGPTSGPMRAEPSIRCPG